VPEGKILGYISLTGMPDTPHWIFSFLSHHVSIITASLSRQLLLPMAYTAPSSARVYTCPHGSTVSHMDPHMHDLDSFGVAKYKTNQEVLELVLLFV